MRLGCASVTAICVMLGCALWHRRPLLLLAVSLTPPFLLCWASPVSGPSFWVCICHRYLSGCASATVISLGVLLPPTVLLSGHLLVCLSPPSVLTSLGVCLSHLLSFVLAPGYICAKASVFLQCMEIIVIFLVGVM